MKGEIGCDVTYVFRWRSVLIRPDKIGGRVCPDVKILEMKESGS